MDPSLANVAVSTTVTADVPVIVERAMYWPGGGGEWYEAHNSFGATAVGTRWGLAEGRVGMGEGFETYILLANSNHDAGRAGPGHVPAHQRHDRRQGLTR